MYIVYEHMYYTFIRTPWTIVSGVRECQKRPTLVVFLFFCCSSVGSSTSYKIKKDIEELNDNECLNQLLLLKPCKYRYIDDNKNFDAVKKVYGLIAEEVKEVAPDSVLRRT